MYGGSLHLPKLKQQACLRSPIARTFFVLEREFEIHITITNRAFPIKITPLEQAWRKTPSYTNISSPTKTATQKHLNKIYMFGITIIAQIQNPNTMDSLTPDEFQNRYKKIPNNIKLALQQIKVLFPTPPPPSPHTIQPLPPPNIILNIPQQHIISTQPTLGCAIHSIIKKKNITKKDKWGAQAIKQHTCINGKPLPPLHNKGG